MSAKLAAELVRKYEQLLHLRQTLPHLNQPRPLTDGERQAVREFAGEFPGALRELDRLPTEEIERRLVVCKNAAETDAPLPDWAAQIGGYHAWMSAALAARQPAGPASDKRFADIAQRWDITIDKEFIERARKPTGRRLMVEVFAQLSHQFNESQESIWDRLFPERGGSRRDYRRL